jgi:hypothetical protein
MSEVPLYRHAMQKKMQQELDTRAAAHLELQLLVTFWGSI